MPDYFDGHSQAMKGFAILAAILALVYPASAGPPTWQELNSHLYTNGPIVWQASTDKMPKSFWTYKMLTPRRFTRAVLSNAVVLASLESKGFPEPSLQNSCFLLDDCQSCQCIRPCYFSIMPETGGIAFNEPHQNNLSDAIPDDDDIVKLAFECAARFGLTRPYLIPRKVYVTLCDSNRICGRGIFLSRSLDGIGFRGNGNDESPEGFGMEVGGNWQIRSFSLAWPELVREKSSRTLNAAEIISCIRAHKAIVLPAPDEEDYFARLKTLATAKKLTITKIIPYYGEGIIGEVPTNDLPPEFVTPFAELEAVADFGNSNAVVQLVSPILSSEVNRLLAK